MFKVDDRIDPFKQRIEINGSERKTLWNIEWFESYEQTKTFEDEFLTDKVLLSGDIVYITNKHSGAYLTITEKNLEKMIVKKKMQFDEEDWDQNGATKTKSAQVEFLREKVENKHAIKCEYTSKMTLYSIWEI